VTHLLPSGCNLFRNTNKDYSLQCMTGTKVSVEFQIFYIPFCFLLTGYGTHKARHLLVEYSCLLGCYTLSLIQQFGRAMVQAVSRRSLTAEAQVRSWVSPCVICGGQRGTGTGFFPPSTSVFPCRFHSTGAPLLGKVKKLIIFLFIFITDSHNKPQSCGASVASAAGTFTTKEQFPAFQWLILPSSSGSNSLRTVVQFLG
jgi:hypothetical protein